MMATFLPPPPLTALYFIYLILQCFFPCLFSFVITVEFRALSPNGILLLAMDNFSNPSQFVSLELVNGNLVYQFNTGRELVKMKTEGVYTIAGVWYKVCSILGVSIWHNKNRVTGYI